MKTKLLFLSVITLFAQFAVNAQTIFSVSTATGDYCVPNTLTITYTGTCTNTDPTSYSTGVYGNTTAFEEYSENTLPLQSFNVAITSADSYFVEVIDGCNGYEYIQIDFGGTMSISDSYACVNDPISFGINGNIGLTNIDWDFGDGNTSNSLTPTNSYAQIGTYNVTAECTTTCGIQTITRTVTIAPQFDFSITYSDSCAPSNITLTNTGCNTSGQYYDYWIIQDTLTEEGTNLGYNTGGPLVVSVTNPGTQYLVMVVYDATLNYIGLSFYKPIFLYGPASTSFNDTICGGPYVWNGQSYASSGVYSQTLQTVNGCDSIVTLNLIVHNDNFNTNFTVNQQLFTSPPFVAQFTNNTPNASNYNFSWDFGNGTILQSNNPTVFHNFLYNGIYDVSLIATNTLTGCSDTLFQDDFIYCTGGTSCTHSATINQSGPITACDNDGLFLTCNTNSSFSYQWKKNGVNIAGANNSTFYPTTSGSYTVQIFENNCPVESNSISVTINASPSVSITSSGTITACAGGSLTLSAPGGFTSYEWNTGATASSINVTQSGNYAVTVTNSNGCARTSNPYTVNASFMSAPNVCVVGMDSLTNQNRVVWEKPITAGIDSFYVYKETTVSDVYAKIGATDYPDLAVFMDQNSNPAVQAYRYKLTVLDTCGTETPLSDFHKTIHLTINAGVGGAWNLIWSHYEGLTFGSYNIYRGTDPTNISLLTTIQSNLNSYTDLTPPVGPVYYQIEIVNPNSCDPTKVVNYNVSLSNIVNNGVTGINGLVSTSVLVYPNPTSKDVTLEITAELLGKDYYLTDNTGRIILSGQFRALKETVNLEQISTGVYFIKIDNNANLMYKIVKN